MIPLYLGIDRYHHTFITKQRQNETSALTLTDFKQQQHQQQNITTTTTTTTNNNNNNRILSKYQVSFDQPAMFPN
jgi:hypothetical protein